MRLRKSDGCGQGVMHNKGSVGLRDLQHILGDALYRVVERSIPRHQGTLTQTADEATIAHLNIMPRQFPCETALALFHESYLMGIRWHKFLLLAVHSYTPHE